MSSCLSSVNISDSESNRTDCCKTVVVPNFQNIRVTYNHALAFVIWNETDGSYLYEGESMSMGSVFQPAPENVTFLNLTTGGPTMLIPNRLFRAVIQLVSWYPNSHFVQTFVLFQRLIS